MFGVIAFAAQSRAQPAPSTISCNDRDGHAVTGVQVTNGVLAKARIDNSGKPVIEYDPRLVSGISPQEHLFVYAHECGHHGLGHDVGRSSMTPAQEHDADCYGIRLLMNRAGVTADDVQKLEEDMQTLGAGDARRLPWSKRAYDLSACLPRNASGETADAHPPNPADACVDHQDASNQIVSKSRDGRSIIAVYSAANHCTHDVVCAFTIETGTLPDTDADAGSFARFHPRKMRTEDHPLKAGVEADFRFQETVDSVPDGESVDYRVTVACR